MKLSTTCFVTDIRMRMRAENLIQIRFTNSYIRNYFKIFIIKPTIIFIPYIQITDCIKYAIL